MRAVIQRVSHVSVTVNGEIVSKMGNGLLVLVGIQRDDNRVDMAWLSKKITNLRIFADSEGMMNCSVLQTKGDITVVSQFTLHAHTKKGNRPSFTNAAKPDVAIPLYEEFILQLEKDLGRRVGTGVFGADMEVELLNDGPVTILIDTKNKE